MANYATDGSGFLNQFSDQLKTQGQTQNDSSSQQNNQEKQPEWTEEQIQQYYQQYYSYYGVYPSANTDNSQTYSAPPSQPSHGQQRPPHSQQQQQHHQPQPQHGAPQHGQRGGPPHQGPPGQQGPGQGFDYSTYAAYTDPSALAAAYAYEQSYYGRPTPTNLPPGEPTRSIWLGNVHPETTEADLHSLFGGFGLVESVRSCAFVKFYELDAAIQAHTSMIGGSIHGQQFRIGWGKSEPSRDDGGPPPCRNLWVGNLSGDVSEELVRSVFGQFGPVEKVRMLPAKSCAFVNFATLDAAIAARQQLQGAMIGDQPVKINFGKENPKDEQDAPKPIVDELPPPDQPPPASYAEQQVIDKLADFVARNGLKFEVLTQEKQKDNPKFAFLQPGHPHHGYYRCRIWCLRHPGIDPRTVTPDMVRQPESDPFSSYSSAPTSAPPATYGAVPPPSNLQNDGFVSRNTGPSRDTPAESPEVRELGQKLDTLVATKESIKATKTWLAARPAHATEFARHIRGRMQRAQSFETKLNLIHLIHDLLHHAARERGKEEGSEKFIAAFQPHLGSILQSSVDREPSESREKVYKVLRIWEDKKIYNANDLRDWEDQMRSTERRDHSDRSDRSGDRKRRDRDDPYYDMDSKRRH